MSGPPAGVVQLDRAVTSIRLGRRHRADLGDLTELMTSIGELGLLQPITITPDGTLICGARRLEAARRLGMRVISVWVRAGISDPLVHLLAEQHENTLRKPYSPREAAALYRELKTLIAQDNRRRQAATRFGSDRPPDGAASLAAPSQRTSRAQAARLVTGRNSYTTLERISELERLALDPATPTDVRTLAAEELEALDRHGNVEGRYKRVAKARDGAARGEPDTAIRPDPPSVGQEPADTPPSAQPPLPGSTGRSRRVGVRKFVLALDAIDGWTAPFDPAVIGPALTTTQWSQLTAAADATVAFVAAADAAR